MKIAFCTLGCKVNQYETNAMAQKFIEAGNEIVGFHEVADIYIINTCSVTNMSDKKSRQMLRKAKMQNKDAVIVAVGCYVQVGKEELEKIKEIDVVLGNNEKNDIVKYVQEYFESKTSIVKTTEVLEQREFLDFGTTTYTEKTRAVIKVQDGCDRFCSYCIIPYARGRVRSRSLASIITEIEEISKKGIKEVVLTGIHIASYGKDFNEDIGLIDLLEKVNGVSGIERIRIGSLEPTIIDERFIGRIKKMEKMCHHFHLSLQSGCNETLKRMNRRYTAEEFRKSVELLRGNFDDVCLTTDIIVGFPGETASEFENTYEYLKVINFYKMHIFKYSPRKGTKAESMLNQIDGNMKEERSNRLLELSEQNQIEQNKQYIGKIVNVLFEEKQGEFYKGHTSNYIVVNTRVKESLENCIKKVKIKEIQGEELYGEIIEQKWHD